MALRVITFTTSNEKALEIFNVKSEEGKIRTKIVFRLHYCPLHIFSRPSDIDRTSPEPSNGQQHKAKPLPFEITICLDTPPTDSDSGDDSPLLHQFN